MIKRLNDFIQTKLDKCKNKKQKIALKGMLCGIALACAVKDEQTLNSVMEVFDQAIKQLVEEE